MVINRRQRADLVAERVQHIPPSGIRKFFDLLGTMEGVISLGVGEPDFTTPWHIREAAIHSIEQGYTMYTSNYGILELREELARHLARTYEVVYDPRRELLITVGVSEALDLALRAILNPGEEVIIPDPGYVSYMPCTVLAGGKVVSVPTRVEDDFKVSAAAIEARVTPATKAILLGYPNNPTGAVLTHDELAAIAEVAKRNDLLVISDEIYDRLVYDGDHTCFSSLPGMHDRTILLGGFSKSYAMTGWRIGYAAAPADILEAMLKIHQYGALCAPIMSQKAAIQALKAGEGDVQEMVADYNRRRRVMVKGLNDIGLSCFEPKGAFYAFPSVASTGLSSESFAERLLYEEKVAVVPGSAFGEAGEGYVRCCYATSLEHINEALKRIDSFVRRYAKSRSK
ncbi:MAG: aminotransferase class I/II-fold pyridoxal phosphate-dependent enzyme [Dehalococcoidales bacterium]|nr:aminotransferase class I/II-fold pyridoxal phosphate-dependent enzyme [Dehalococcoidales bacterium]